MRSQTIRLILAVLIAPLCIAAVWGAIGLIMGSVQAALFFSIYALLVALCTLMVFGIPTHIILNRSRQYDLASYLLAGGAIGMVPVLAMLFGSLSNARALGIEPVAIMAAIILPSALLTAGIAWAIARPDRYAENEPDAKLTLGGQSGG